MKKINFFIVVPFILVTIFACEDFMDVHKEYIEGGEILYAPKPDSLKIYAGENRVLLKCWLYNAVNVKSIDVFWNEYKDSMIVEVNDNSSFTAGVDSINFFIPNIEESMHTFHVRTTDIWGNHSLFESTLGSSYGKMYQSGLNNRRIQSIYLDADDKIKIRWLSKLPGMIATEVKYITAQDKECIIRMSIEENNFVLPDAKKFTQIQYRTLYLPEENAVDTFFTDWVTFSETIPGVRFSKEKFNIIPLENDADWNCHNGKVEYVIDGSLNTFAHTQAGVPDWGNATKDLESSLTIDFGEWLNVERIVLYNRYSKGYYRDANVKRLALYYCDHEPSIIGNWDEWILLGEFSIDKPSGILGNEETELDKEVATTGFPLRLDNIMNIRYLRVKVLETWGKKWYTHIAELDILGDQ